eukprot:3159355-Rhodomonas_salina.1
MSSAGIAYQSSGCPVLRIVRIQYAATVSTMHLSRMPYAATRMGPGTAARVRNAAVERSRKRTDPHRNDAITRQFKSNSAICYGLCILGTGCPLSPIPVLRHVRLCCYQLQAYGDQLMVVTAEVLLSISLRACYAMSGTGVAYGGICRRTCYAMSGTACAPDTPMSGRPNRRRSCDLGDLRYHPTLTTQSSA